MSVPSTAAPADSAGAEARSTEQSGASTAQEPRVDPTQASRAEPQEQDKRGPDYVRQAFMAMRNRPIVQASAAPAPAEAPQAPPASSRPAQEPDRSAPPATSTTLPPAARQGTPPPTLPSQQRTPPADQITLTPAELDRRIQAETDRRLAKQQADDEARRSREREVELRRTNPFEYARLMEEKEAALQESQDETKKLTELLTSQLTQYDRNILDPLVSALPENIRKQVIAPDEGIVGRKKTAEAAIKALRQLARTEALEQAKVELRKDQTFIKEILARYGGQAQEPESVQARPPSPSVPRGEQGMNGWIRAAARGVRSD